jgi:hypothetical protein
MDTLDVVGLFVESDRVALTMNAVTSTVMTAMLNYAVSEGKSRDCCGINACDWHEVGAHVSAHMGASRYFWSGSQGWVDLQHMLRAAVETRRWFLTGGMVWDFGVAVEKAQASVGNISAFGVEDLPSNHHGIQMADLIEKDNMCDLPKWLEAYVSDTMGGLSGSPPTANLPQFNLIRNLSYRPVLSPTSTDLKVDTYVRPLSTEAGIKYMPSGTTVDNPYLALLYAGGIDGSTLGTAGDVPSPTPYWPSFEP